MKKKKTTNDGKNKSSSGNKKDVSTAGKNEVTARAIAGMGPNMPVPVDFVEARKNVATLVRMAANDIAAGLIEQAKSGELAPTKYLFELAGLYPATPETSSKPENSLAYALLKRMGLPTDPMSAEEDAEPSLFSSAAEPVAAPEGDAREKCESGFDQDSEAEMYKKFSNSL